MPAKGRILIIDDDRDFLEFARIILESEGYTVFTAEDGEEGVAVAQRTKPDIVLVDVMMSYILDGLNVVRTLRMDPAYRGVPIVLISAIISADERGLLPSGQHLDSDAFLSKPIEPATLLRTVGQLLHRSAPPN